MSKGGSVSWGTTLTPTLSLCWLGTSLTLIICEQFPLQILKCWPKKKAYHSWRLQHWKRSMLRRHFKQFCWISTTLSARRHWRHRRQLPQLEFLKAPPLMLQIYLVMPARDLVAQVSKINVFFCISRRRHWQFCSIRSYMKNSFLLSHTFFFIWHWRTEKYRWEIVVCYHLWGCKDEKEIVSKRYSSFLVLKYLLLSPFILILANVQ